MNTASCNFVSISDNSMFIRALSFSARYSLDTSTGIDSLLANGST